MDRKEFLTNSVIAAGTASLFPFGKDVFAAPFIVEKLDNLQNEEGDFILPDLPYSYDALEPYMDSETLHLHHTFHHGGAVKGLNKDVKNIDRKIKEGQPELLDHWVKKSAYHGSSHILHSIFWTNLKTDGSKPPQGKLLKAIEKDFGSFDKLKVAISSVSKTVEGSGWGILAYQPFLKKLVVFQCEDHSKLTQWGAIPLLVIDVWEHAYYLKYKNKRGEFVDAMFNIVNWDNVALRYNQAIKNA